MKKLNDWDLCTLINLVRHEIDYTGENLRDEEEKKVLERLENLEEKLTEMFD